jgi:hypothetical protein
LRRGLLIDLEATETTYVYLREAGDERLVVALNFDSEPTTLRIRTERIEGATQVEGVFGTARARIDGKALALEMPGESAAVLRVWK